MTSSNEGFVEMRSVFELSIEPRGALSSLVELLLGAWLAPEADSNLLGASAVEEAHFTRHVLRGDRERTFFLTALYDPATARCLALHVDAEGDNVRWFRGVCDDCLDRWGMLPMNTAIMALSFERFGGTEEERQTLVESFLAVATDLATTAVLEPMLQAIRLTQRRVHN